MVEDLSFKFCINRWKVGQVNGLAYLIRELCDFDESDRVRAIADDNEEAESLMSTHAADYSSGGGKVLLNAIPSLLRNDHVGHCLRYVLRPETAPAGISS